MSCPPTEPERYAAEPSIRAAWAERHWLLLANAAVGLFAGLPVLAPWLLYHGQSAPALLIYSLYGTTCHQWPGRSFFLFGPHLLYGMDELERSGLGMAHQFLGTAEMGFKMAYCERNFAIYTTVAIAGLVYALVRRQVGPLSWPGLALCLLPLALDGVSQLFGWRESTWELRALTGALAGAAGVWFAYPRVDRALRGTTCSPARLPSAWRGGAPGAPRPLG